MRILYYKFLQKLLTIFLAFLTIQLCIQSSYADRLRYCLSPKSNVYNEMILLEKKEVFIKNTVHGSSSPFFTLSNVIMGLSGNIQFIIYDLKNQKLYDETFITYLTNKNKTFLSLYEKFQNMINENVFSEIVDIEKAWGIFKKIFVQVKSESYDLQIRLKDLIKKNNLKFENELNNKILNLITKVSEQMSAIFEISINCVENPEKLFEIVNIDDCINYLNKISKNNNSYTDFKIEIDSNISGDKRIIVGNRILLNNVFENFLNNSMQHRNNKVRVKVFIDEKANEVVFAFENDAKPIPQQALEKVNDRERLFYLNYSTKGMGVGTTLAWYVANIFNHSINVQNLNEGVLFEYRIPLLSISNAENYKINKQFKLDEVSNHLKKSSELIPNSSINAAA